MTDDLKNFKADGFQLIDREHALGAVFVLIAIVLILDVLRLLPW